ncbi:MAG: murein biosynthesis integral membrane protein MurJ [Eggerthellaceae bacterium]|nr:murein biosynthesis integral membrane protein MurJ [Eggerthellaceae bacterium]
MDKELQGKGAPDSVSDDVAQSVAKSTLLMTIATLGSRATGLIRTWAMAFALGNTFLTSAYQVANNMPNVIFELVAGGILGAAFIPVYLLQKEKFGPEGGNRFGNTILNLTIIVLGILTILATIFAPQVIATQTFTVEDTAQVTQYSIMFFRIFAIQIVFYGIGGVVTGILNANRVYFLPSLAPALNNVVVIASFFAYIPLSSANPELALWVLGVGASLGVLVQFVIQIPALKKMGFSWSLSIDLHDPALIEALKIAIPTFVYIVGMMVSFSCRNAFSLEASENGPSTLIYAWTWLQLPHGVVAVSLSRALFTEMSEAVAKDDWNAMRAHVRAGIAGTLVLIIPLAVLMGLFSPNLIQLFRAGAFSADDVAYVGHVLMLWVISLPFYSVLMYLYNVFASMRKFHIFAIVNCLMVVVQCVLYSMLCSTIGLSGVPAADFVFYAGCTIIMIIILHRYIGNFGIATILWTMVRVVAASAIGLVAAWAVTLVIPTIGTSMVSGLLQLIVAGCIGLIVTFIFCYIFRIPEMKIVTDLLGKVKRKIARK